jgi:hypothetical protein
MLLHVGARPMLRQLGTAGASDVFRFEVPRSGRYLVSAVRVTGASPYAVELHGRVYPNPKHVDTNTTITYRLDPGMCYFAVRASDRRSTGQYAVAIRDAGR